MVETFARQRQLIGSTAEWAVDDIVLALGEIGIEQVSSVDIRIKVGNGVDPWSLLPYISTFTSNINTETLDALAAQVSRSGDTMTGPLILSGDPVDVLGAVTKQYADAVRSDLTAQIDTRVIKTGDTMSGHLSHDLAPTAPQHTATKAYVDASDDARVAVAGDAMTGPLLLSGPPTDDLHAATKAYVDNGSYQSVVGGDVTYAGKVVKLNASGMLDTSIVPISSIYIGPINPTLSYTLTGSYTVGSYFAVQLTGTIDASWNTKINGAPSTCSAGQLLIYNANGKWDLIGEPVSDVAIAGKLDKAGGTMTGALFLAADPTTALGAATKQYVDTKASVSYVDAQVATRQVAGSYATASHTHIFADVTGLQTALDGKAASSHTHIIANVTGLQTALDGKQTAGNYANTDVANTFLGNITISRGANSPLLILDANAGVPKGIQLRSGGGLRWQLNQDVTGETGSNAGSNFIMYRYGDNGTTNLGSVFSITRSSGLFYIPSLSLNFSGLVKAAGSSTALAAAVAGTDYLAPSAIGSTVQAYDADLGAIAALAGTSGFLKKTAANTWTLDTATYAPLASPAFTGTPTAPTAASGTNTTQIATTAFVQTTANEICKLLGTITTTASSASLSSLTLSSYKYLMLVFNGCNTSGGTGATTTLNSLQIASSGVSGALTGHMFIDLGSGVGTSMLGANGVQAGATGITTATTTITFTRSGSNAGSIRVYGIQ